MAEVTLIREFAPTVRHDPEATQADKSSRTTESLNGILIAAFVIGTTVDFPITEVTTSEIFCISDASGTAYYMVQQKNRRRFR